MNGTQAVCVLGSRLALAWIFTWILKFLVKIFLPFNIPSHGIFVLCLAYIFQIHASGRKTTKSRRKTLKSKRKTVKSHRKTIKADRKIPKSVRDTPESDKKPPESISHSIPNKETSDSTPQYAQKEVEKQILNKLQQLLQVCGTLIEGSGTSCAEILRKIYKDQKNQLRQYNDFRTQHIDQFGPTVDVLESRTKDTAENSQAVSEQRTTLCKIIGQYRQIVEDTRKYVQRHAASFFRALKDQDGVMAQTREIFDERDKSNKEIFDERDKSNKEIFDSQRQLVEHNERRMQEHGASIDSVVSDHVNLVAEYQKELDGLALLITTNRIFTLIHATPKWESLRDQPWRTGAVQGDAHDTRQLTKHHKKLIKQPQLGRASASVVDNVQQIARTFKNTSQDVIKDTHGKPKVTGQKTWAPTRGSNSTKVQSPDWKLGTSSGMDQLMATVLGQPEGKIQTNARTLQTMAGARHTEATEQLRQGQEDMEKLRSDIACIQECQRTLRAEQQRREKLRKSRLEVEAFREKLAQQDMGRQTQCREAFSEEARRHLRAETVEEPADEDTMTSATTTTAATGSTDGDTLTAATITDPTNVTDPGVMPTPESADNGDVGALAAWDHEADAPVDDEDWESVDEDGGQGRLPARKDWPDTRRSRSTRPVR